MRCPLRNDCCPHCGASVTVMQIQMHVDVPGVDKFRWKCLVFASHTGEWTEDQI